MKKFNPELNDDVVMNTKAKWIQSQKLSSSDHGDDPKNASELQGNKLKININKNGK